MSTLAWTDALRVNQPQMDRTHQEFVALLADVHRVLEEDDGHAGPTAFERLLAHTVEHFETEDRWMRATGFSADNCHSRQHAMVLQLMREVLRLAQDGQPAPLVQVVHELAQWFPLHAQMMDAGLASHLADVGFDPETGTASGALPEAAMTHCGSAGCR